MLRILLIGGGGREHALAHALRQSPSCTALFCAPGNPGIARYAELIPLDITNHDAVCTWCRENEISLVVIGPEQPLEAGLSDALRAQGFTVFGPSRAAAQLEWSKSFAKDFMARHNIPTASYKTFAHVIPSKARDSVAEARAYILSQPTPIVIKYDGLAAGKGVVVAQTHDEAVHAVESMFEGEFGEGSVVVEGFLRGREASVFAVCDGTDYVVLAPSQDHKRIGDGDTGPNTGGMGAYAPAPIVTDEIMQKVKQQVIEPTLRGMASEGNPFVGCLYCGLMIDDGEINVVEFNTRFGDPETQVVMSILDADTAALFASAAKGKIDNSTIREIVKGCAVSVVIASGGYPGEYRKGLSITGIDEAESDDNVIVYHAGTKMVDGVLTTNGGRVLGVTGFGQTIEDARQRAYAACEKIAFDGKYLRTDIAATL